MIYGYARVSTEDQDNSRQVKDLLEFGCDKIYEEKISGATKIRPMLNELLKQLKPKDMVVVIKLDRLGRSLSHLIDLIEFFKTEGVEFKSLGDSIDTTTPQGLFMLQMMGAFSEFERNMISERVKHGLAFKRSQGVVLGRPKIDQSELIEAINERLNEGKRAKDIQKELKLTAPRYHRLLNSQSENIPKLG